MKPTKLLILVIFLVAANAAFSQNDIVKKNLKLVADGKIDEVKRQVPDLLAKYPDHPGILLLQGVVVDDAALAVEVYKRIVDEFPKNEWGDDAYWRIVQYYAVKGDVDKARAEIIKFRKDYPNSEFLLPATDLVSLCEKLNKGQKKAAVVQNANSEEDEGENEEDATPVKDKSKELKKVDLSGKSTKTEIISKDTGKNSDKANGKKEVTEIKKKSGTYGLQVGVFSTEDAARHEKENLLKYRFLIEIVPKMVEGKKMYSVVVGNYSSKAIADSHVQEVKSKCNCQIIVVEK